MGLYNGGTCIHAFVFRDLVTADGESVRIRTEVIIVVFPFIQESKSLHKRKSLF